jgi:hypothetical protein
MSFLIHAIIEIPIIKLLVSDFDRWGFGLSWNVWFILHGVWSVLLFLTGVYFGYKQGKRWWKVLYEDKKH